MKHPTILAGLIACSGLLGSSCVSHTAPAPASRSSASVGYSAAASELLARISIARVDLTDEDIAALAARPRFPSGLGDRVLLSSPADTMQPGPWTSRFTILDAPGSRAAVIMEFRDHASYGVSHAWLNDKLLFLRVWWGRIVSTDCVLDLETLRFIYAEDAHYFSTAYSHEVQPPGRAE